MSRSLRALAPACAAVLLLALAPVAARAADRQDTRSAEPGAVLSTEELPRELWLDGAASALRMTYVTTGPHGTPAESSGAMFVPAGEPPKGGWPVVSWAHGTVGVADRCAPSVAGRSERDVTYLNHWLAQGYAVAATDYAGLGTPGAHAYLEGSSEGYAVVDAVRAAREIDESLARRWVVIGQSQGGQGALFATHLAPDYAPELDFRGGVATGPVSNLDTLTSAANPLVPPTPIKDFPAYLGLIFQGVEAARPAFDVDRYLSDIGRAIVDDAATYCFRELVERTKDVGVGQMLERPLDEEFTRTLDEIAEPPTSGYQRPFFIGQGTNDTTVLLPLTSKMVGEMSAAAQPLTFKAYPGAGHSETMAASLPDTTPYVAELLADRQRDAGGRSASRR